MNTNPKTIELIKKVKDSYLFLIFILAIGLRFLHVPFNQEILIISLSTVGTLNLYKIYIPSSDPTADAILSFFTKLSRMSSSILCLGILFKLQFWPTAFEMCMVGLASLAVGFVVFILYPKMKDLEFEKVQEFNKILIPSAFYLFFGSLIFSISDRKLAGMYYPDPTEADLYYKAVTHQQDTIAQNNLRTYRLERRQHLNLKK